MKTIVALILIIFTKTLISQSSNIEDYRVVAFKNTENGIVSVSNVIKIAKRPRIHVPNAFSPDGDGINDLFVAVSEGIEDFSMNIYNRWGEVVYQSNSIEESWDGSFKGTLSIQDAYIYVIEARGIEDKKFTTLKGTVSLIR